MDDTKLTPH
jgi:hypothetical protein